MNGQLRISREFVQADGTLLLELSDGTVRECQPNSATATATVKPATTDTDPLLRFTQMLEPMQEVEPQYSEGPATVGAKPKVRPNFAGPPVLSVRSIAELAGRATSTVYDAARRLGDEVTPNRNRRGHEAYSQRDAALIVAQLETMGRQHRRASRIN
jgi:hypothetical protein